MIVFSNYGRVLVSSRKDNGAL